MLQTTPLMLHIQKYCAAILAGVLASVGVAVAPGPARAQSAIPEAVTINTNLQVFTPPAALDPYNPPGGSRVPAHASVVLLGSGNGLITLDATGNVIGATGGFLIRSANEFLQRGFNVMIPDSAPAYPAGMTFTDRLSRLDAVHAGLLQNYINIATTRWAKPVWVIGHGNGAISAVTVLGYQPALTGYAGVLLASPTTNLSSNAANQALFNTYVSHITSQVVQVIWHTGDTCSFTPPAGSSALFQSIASPNKQSNTVSGGHSVAADPCGGIAESAFAGLEVSVVAMMADYVRSNGSSRPPNGPMPTALSR